MADLTDQEIAELRRLALLEADEPSSAASDVLLTPNGQRIVARLLVDGRLLPMLDEVERRRQRDARTLALLRHIEFASVQSGDLVCPECICVEATGHADDCDLARLIADSTLDETETTAGPPIRYDFLDGDIFFEGKDLNGRELLVRRGPSGILVVEAEEDECDQCGPDGCRVRNHLDIVPIPDAVARDVGLAIIRASAHGTTKTHREPVK